MKGSVHCYFNAAQKMTYARHSYIYGYILVAILFKVIWSQIKYNKVHVFFGVGYLLMKYIL